MILRVCLISKTELRISSCWNATQIETIRLILRNVIFNRSLFAKSEIAIGFVASKWVLKWSRILILSLSWSCMQNETKILIINLKTVPKNLTFFANDFKYSHIIYCWKEFFGTIMNLRSLSQNKVLFGLDQLAKFVAYVQKSVSTIRSFSTWTKGTIVTKRVS